MYPPPQNYPPPSPFGAPGAPFAQPVPASATVLLVCGILKLITAAFCFLIGAVVIGGAAVVADTTSRSGDGGVAFFGGLGSLFAGGLGVVLFCAGAAVVVSGLLDTIGGNLARKGKASGRIMGIISAVLGLLGTMGSLTSLMLAPENTSNPESSMAGGLTGVLITGGLNLYLLVSFIRNGDAFKN